MKSYVVGKDSFSHGFEVSANSGLVYGLGAFGRLTGGWPRPGLCLVATSLLGALVLNQLAEGPFLQFFYIQLLLFAVLIMLLVLSMKRGLDRNRLGAGRYKLESDDTMLRVSSGTSGSQRFGLGNIREINVSDTGSDIVMQSGFTIPVSGLKLEMAGNIEERPLPPEDRKSIWFAEQD